MKWHKVQPFNFFYSLATEEEVKTWAKKKKVLVELGDLEASFGYACGSGGRSFVVMNPKRNKNPWDAVDTIIHESVHIFQACMKWVEEGDIGHEMEAYSIATISTNLLKDYNALHEGRKA